MRATLIYPGIGRYGFNAFGNVPDPEANFIHHGLASISAYAKEQGHEIDLIDLRRLQGWEQFAKAISVRSPGCFGITSMSVDYGVVQRCVAEIKRIDPRSVVILGGVHATVALEDVRRNEQIDYIVVGEGEIVFSDLLNRLQRGEECARVLQATPPDLDNLPWVDRELFDYNGELHTPWMRGLEIPNVSIIAGRGCPYHCRFCQPAERLVFGNRIRLRRPDDIIAELKDLRNRYGFRTLIIHDDLFFLNAKYLRAFADAYERAGFTQAFVCQARADLIVRNEKVVKQLRDVGLSALMIGFESGNQRILNFINKGTTVEQNLRAAEICHRYGIKIFANYMLGLPTETKEEVFDTVRLIRHIRPEQPSPSFFTPTPGTELYDYCQKRDLILIKTYEGYRRSPTEPKLKGIDYNLLAYAREKSREYVYDDRLQQLEQSGPPQPGNVAEIQRLRELKRQLRQMDVSYGYYDRSTVATQTQIKRVLLINTPTAEDGYVSREMAGGLGFDSSARMILPPLDLAYLAATLRQEGYDISILDGDGAGLTRQAVLQQARQLEPQAVIATLSLPSMKRDISFVRKLRQGLAAVVAVRTLIPYQPIIEEILAESGADYVIHGECDLTIGQILRAETQAGTAYLEAGKLVWHEDDKPTNLDALPLPARDLLTNERYCYPLLGQGTTTVQSSRGCPYACRYYCPYPLVQGRLWRARSPEHVFTELEDIVRNHGLSRVLFRDATFTLDMERTHAICDLIIENKLPLRWWCETRVDRLDEPLLRKMHAAGCAGINVGVETGDEAVMAAQAKRGLTIARLAAFRHLAQEIGVKVHFLMSIGHPEETRRSVVDSYELIRNLQPESLGITLITPYPGTPLFTEAKERDWIESYDWSQYGGHQPVMHTDRLSAKELKEALQRLWCGYGLVKKQAQMSTKVWLRMENDYYLDLEKWALSP